METKHINDKLDPTAVEVKELSAQMDGSIEAADQPGAEASSTADAAANARPARVGYIVHRLAGRTAPGRRRWR